MDLNFHPHILDAIISYAALEYRSSPYAPRASPNAPRSYATLFATRPPAIFAPAVVCKRVDPSAAFAGLTLDTSSDILRPNTVITGPSTITAPIDAASTVLGLRGVSRAVRDQFDALLLNHIALAEDTILCPNRRRIPRNYNVDTGDVGAHVGNVSALLRRHLSHVRLQYKGVIDIYPDVPVGLHWSRFEIARCLSSLPGVPMPTILYRSSEAGDLPIPQGVRTLKVRHASREGWARMTSWCHCGDSYGGDSRTLENLVLLFDNGVLPGFNHDADGLFLTGLALCLFPYGLVARGGCVTFVVPAALPFRTRQSIRRLMFHLARQYIAALSFGDPPPEYMGFLDRFVLGVDWSQQPHPGPDDTEPLSKHVRIISWEKWRGESTPLELEWLDGAEPGKYRLR